MFFMCLIAISVVWVTMSVDWFGRAPACASRSSGAITTFSLLRRTLRWCLAMTLFSGIMQRSEMSVFFASGFANKVCHPPLCDIGSTVAICTFIAIGR